VIRNLNPATLEPLAGVAEDTPASVADRAAKARTAQRAWAATPYAARRDAVNRFKALLVRERDRLAKTLSDEMGKPLKQAQNELDATPGRIDFFLGHAEQVLADEVVAEGGTEERIRWEPLGVVANISAWNYPYFVGTNVFVPALLTGNAVLYKPSEFVPLTGKAIGELWLEAGVPADVFQVVQGSGAIGAELLKAPLDAVFFTGSYATGRRIAEAVAGRLIKVQLELGGKDPAYVLDDADPAAAAESLADGAFYNTGQSCCAVERVYVHERIAAPFIEKFVETVRGFKSGPPLEEGTYIGPLAREAQLAVLDEQVRDAVEKGARVVVGGKRAAGKGHYFEPTVLTGVDGTMKVMRDESFGPIIGIQVVKSDEEALAAMNDTEYGLTAGVYGKSRERAEAILRGVQSGTAYFNCCDRVSPRLPWTGRRHSGIGSTLSTHGIRAFVQPKAWHWRAS
jgi:acyl-CoA reductase-like NAD-dependent aldehyde dehydrogenase